MRGGAAAGQGGGGRRDPELAVSAAADAAGGVSGDSVSRPARRGLCDPGDPRFPGCRTWARLRGRDGEERGVAAACRIRRWPWPARRARPVAEPSTSIPTPRYAARTWGRERRVVIKAEVVRLKGREPRDNPRFVVTNLLESSRFVYERVYCARGTSRTGSRSCWMACRSTARAAASSWRTSCACC